MEFKDKIMLYCFREVKCKQVFTTGTRYYLYNGLGVIVNMCISGLMVNESEFKSGAPRSFPWRGGYKLTLFLRVIMKK